MLDIQEEYGSFEVYTKITTPQGHIVLTKEEFFLWNERAAIMECDGCMPREEAEKKATEAMIARRLWKRKKTTSRKF